MEKTGATSTIRILAVVEATNVNAVAKNVLEFHRSATAIQTSDPDFPKIETSLVSFDRTDQSKPPNEFVTAARELGLDVNVIRERFRFDTRVIGALRKIVDQVAPDIVVTHQVKSHLLMKLSSLWQEYPWVAFHHGYTTTNRKMRAYNRLNRWSLPQADRVITVCEAFARELASAGVARDRISVQHNSIRPEQVIGTEGSVRFREQLGVSEDDALLLSVGRLSREKAHIDLIAAFRYLRENHSKQGATLVIVGEGPELERLAATAAASNLRERVIFAGQIQDVRPFYAAANVVVLPSHSEGSPYVLLEAMAAKVPVVATAVGGVPEMVKDAESALLVPVSDPRAMAIAIERVLADSELARRLTENAFNLVETRYSPKTYVSSLIEIYREVISTSNR